MMIRNEWQHPNLGRIREITCPEHDRELLWALRTLGIGCGSTSEPFSTVCDRCAHQGQRVRAWLPERVVT